MTSTGVRKKVKARWATAVLTTALAGAISVPASAIHHGNEAPAGCRWIRGTGTPKNHNDDVYACRKDVWIHQSDLPVGNPAGLGLDSYPTWDSTPPTGWFFRGEGAVTVVHGDPFGWNVEPDPDEIIEPTTSFVTEGQVTGNLENLAATMYVSRPLAPAPDPWGYSGPLIQLVVDSKIVFRGRAGIASCPHMNTGIRVFRIRFALTGVHKALGGQNDPTKQHTVRLLLNPFPLSEDGLFYFDAREFPAGIVFNIEESNLGSYTKIAVDA